MPVAAGVSSVPVACALQSTAMVASARNKSECDTQKPDPCRAHAAADICTEASSSKVPENLANAPAIRSSARLPASEPPVEAMAQHPAMATISTTAASGNVSPPGGAELAGADRCCCRLFFLSVLLAAAAAAAAVLDGAAGEGARRWQHESGFSPARGRAARRKSAETIANIRVVTR